jgi:PAS domain S-box-containing protein
LDHAAEREGEGFEHASLEFLAGIINSVGHPIFVKDREFRFVLLNSAFFDLVGFPRGKMLGKTDYEFFPRSESDFFRSIDVEVFATGRTLTVDAEPITDAAGARHVLATTKVPLRDQTGTITHLVGIIHDITHLKAIEEQLRVANEQLEERVRDRTRELELAQGDLLRQERLAVLGRLAGGLAHQIRNPLASIANAAFVLRRLLRGADAADVERAISIILEETTHANNIITDLLDYARIRPAHRNPVHLDELVRTILAARGVPPSLDLAVELSGLPPVSADSDQLRSALSNLIDNAVDALGGKGRLTITGRANESSVVLGIEDTGAGIPEEVQRRLFEPLVTTKALGLGLGLTTARSLIENQGGRLCCAHTSTSGTRFEVELPVSPSA